MEWQALVKDVRRGRLHVQPLDGIRPIWLAIPRCDRTYIENELLRLPPLPDGSPTDKPIPLEVLGSSLEPTYIDDRPPELELLDEEEQEYGFEDQYTPEVHDRFEAAMEYLRAGRNGAAKRRLRDFVTDYPLHIDAYHHLGNIASEAGHTAHALKYYEMGYRIGRLTLTARFHGRLPWSVLENRPFLRTCHGRALALTECERSIESAEGLAELLSFNPNDNQGVRILLPNVLIENGAWGRAREILDEVGADGTNLYARCLIDIEAGRLTAALGWLCAAVSYNPYVPAALLDPSGVPTQSAQYVTAGGVSEALDYVLHSGAPWRAGRGLAFLRRALDAEPFAERYERLLSIGRELEGMPIGEQRSRLVTERFTLFDDYEVATVVAECDGLL